jgi:transcriptional regulator with XRE-family HTH domain
VLNLIAKGVSQRAIAVQFGVAKSTIGNIDKNREAILKAWEENFDSERK